MAALSDTIGSMKTRSAAIYARISFDPTGSGTRQKTRTHGARPRHSSWDAVAEGDVYIDRSISAYKDKHRPQLAAMLDAVEAGKYAAVIVWKLDRLTRSYNRGGDILRRIDEAGVKLIGVTEQIDTSTPIGKAIVGFQIAQAEDPVREHQQAGRTQAQHMGSAGCGGSAATVRSGINRSRPTRRPAHRHRWFLIRRSPRSSESA